MSKKFTFEEVQKHNTEKDCWCIIENKVLDITKYLHFHPGGADILVKYSGVDATEAFNDTGHSAKASKMLGLYQIGVMDASYSACLKPVSMMEPTPFPIHSVRIISPDTKIFKFALPCSAQLLDLPIGKHLQVTLTSNNEEITRKYTPVRADEPGFFEVLVKGYPKGKLSHIFHNLNIGDKLIFTGPLGRFNYEPNKYTKYAMIAMGSGITPMFQIVSAILNKAGAAKEEKATMKLLFSNKTLDDVILGEDMDGLAAKHPDQFSITYLLSRHWIYGSKKYKHGHVTERSIREHVTHEKEPNTLCLLCGSVQFTEYVTRLLNIIGYTNDDIFVF